MRSHFGPLFLAILSALFTLVAAGSRSPKLNRRVVEDWLDKITSDSKIEEIYKQQSFYITTCPPLKDAHIQLSYAVGKYYPVNRRSDAFDWLSSHVDSPQKINHVQLAYSIQGGKCGMIYVATTVKLGNFIKKDRFRWKEPQFVAPGIMDPVHRHKALGTVKMEELRFDIDEAFDRAMWAFGGLLKGGFKEVAIERLRMQDGSEQPVYRFKQLTSDGKLEIQVRAVDGDAILIDNKKNPLDNWI